MSQLVRSRGPGYHLLHGVEVDDRGAMDPHESSGWDSVLELVRCEMRSVSTLGGMGEDEFVVCLDPPDVEGLDTVLGVGSDERDLGTGLGREVSDVDAVEH